MPDTATADRSTTSGRTTGLPRPRTVVGVAAVVAVLAPVVLGVLEGRLGALVGLAVAVTVLGTGGLAALLLDVRRRLVDLHAAQRRLGQRTGGRLDALEEHLARQDERLTRIPGRPASEASVDRAATALGRRVQATVNLFDLVEVRAGVPALGSWTASADLLVAMLDVFLAERPRVVVEAGSGVSTVFLALAARQHGVDTRIVALEHDEHHAARTRALLERHGVGDGAEVRLAPLGPAGIEGHATPWYDVTALEDLQDIGLLLVDGPPGVLGEGARYPMVPLLRDRLAPRCTILVDDTDRAGDAEVVDRWRPLLPDFSHEVLKLEKGAALLRRPAR